MDNKDEEFIRRINAKQVSAYKELFKRFYSYMVLFAEKKVQRREIAEDIVQEVFISVWEGTKEYNSYHGFRSYLYNAVTNQCLDYLKHRLVEERYLSYMISHQNEESEREYDLMREEIYRELYLAVKELPERCREVFMLYMENKKNTEIAEMLSISVETVKVHKKNAIHFLKERLSIVVFLCVLRGLEQSNF